jgi:hypothetical protein
MNCKIPNHRVCKLHSGHGITQYCRYGNQLVYNADASIPDDSSPPPSVSNTEVINQRITMEDDNFEGNDNYLLQGTILKLSSGDGGRS